MYSRQEGDQLAVPFMCDRKHNKWISVDLLTFHKSSGFDGCVPAELHACPRPNHKRTRGLH